MKPKTKNIIRKTIYGILFLAMIVAFVYLSEKYADNGDDHVITINDYYQNINNSKYKIIRGSKLISLLQEGKSIIFIGSSTSEAAIKYIEELDPIIRKTGVDKIYYYDINNDKAQKNSNYYEIRELLKGSLITTDGSENNLLAPSLYIVDNGKVKYYNIETVAIKNTDKIEDYWTQEKESAFISEVTTAINKYYLNNDK